MAATCLPDGYSTKQMTAGQRFDDYTCVNSQAVCQTVDWCGNFTADIVRSKFLVNVMWTSILFARYLSQFIGRQDNIDTHVTVLHSPPMCL
jgi:hypothetical protein